MVSERLETVIERRPRQPMNDQSGTDAARYHTYNNDTVPRDNDEIARRKLEWFQKEINTEGYTNNKITQ